MLISVALFSALDCSGAGMVSRVPDPVHIPLLLCLIAVCMVLASRLACCLASVMPCYCMDSGYSTGTVVGG